MLDPHGEHAMDIARWISSEVRRKYRLGREEHGGRLWRKPCLPHIVEEVVDLVIYIRTLVDQIEAAREALTTAVEGRQIEEMARVAYNILTYGNADGVEEKEKEKNPRFSWSTPENLGPDEPEWWEDFMDEDVRP